MYDVMKPKSPKVIAQELTKFSDFGMSEEYSITEKIIILTALIEDYQSLPYNFATNKMISNHILNIVEHLNSLKDEENE